MRPAPRSGVLGRADMPAYLRVLRPWLAAHAACHPPWRLSGQAPSAPSGEYGASWRLQSCVGSASSVAPICLQIDAPCVLARLAFRAPGSSRDSRDGALGACAVDDLEPAR